MEELGQDTCWELLRAAEVGRLAVVVEGRPEIFPVNHVVDHGTIVLRTAPGTKFGASVNGAQVAFEVDGYDPATGIAWSVVAKGIGREVRQLHDLLAALDLPISPWHDDPPKHRFVRIEPETLTGRRFEITGRVSTPPQTTRAATE